MPAPLCFVLMPLGRKAASSSGVVDFEDVYNLLIAPAVREADLEPLRAEKDPTDGIIHKPMFERLILCPYAVADLTLANANVSYQLGVRQAVRPQSTVLLFAEGARQPLDVEHLPTIQYRLDGPRLAAEHIDDAKAVIVRVLREARTRSKQKPIFEILDYIPEPIVDHTRTDVFRERIDYSQSLKSRLAEARRIGVDAVRASERDLGSLDDVESAVLVDLMLSYRAVEAYEDMIGVIEKMPRPLAETAVVQEQLGFALNRLKKREPAESVLRDVIERRGPSSETYALLGRVYKDLWEDARNAGDTSRARELLEKAIDAYLKGFETDWRDALPGVNVVTLMELRDHPHPARTAILPVVRYAVERKIAKGKPDYWDYATLLELVMVEMNETQARDALQKARALVRETWEPKTTQRNLRLLRETRERRGAVQPWMLEVEKALGE
jgi:tetratricopeptide (TPR) repeat protein